MVRNDQRRVYYWALLNEIRMLIDYVAANATHSIGEIHLKDPRSPSEEMMMGAILSRLDEINSELEHPSQAAAGHTIKPEDASTCPDLVAPALWRRRWSSDRYRAPGERDPSYARHAE